MKMDLNFMQVVNKKVMKYSMSVCGVLVFVLFCKIYRQLYEYYEVIDWQNIITYLKNFSDGGIALLDSIDGVVVFKMLLVIFVTSLIICHFLRSQILKRGGSLDHDEDSFYHDDCIS